MPERGFPRMPRVLFVCLFTVNTNTGDAVSCLLGNKLLRNNKTWTVKARFLQSVWNSAQRLSTGMIRWTERYLSQDVSRVGVLVGDSAPSHSFPERGDGGGL